VAELCFVRPMKRFLCGFAVVRLSVRLAVASDVSPAAVEKLVREALRQKKPVTNYDKPIVPTAEVAVRIHKAVAAGIYGKKGIGIEPFRAMRSGEFWVVYGDLPKDSFGGVPITVIRASDGKVIWVTVSGQ
jgi:hypothetical protein